MDSKSQVVTRGVGLLSKVYDPRQVESEVAEFWRREQIYSAAKQARSKGPKFYFLDGPPFPSADTPHIGTCWNKVVKDVFIRYKRFRGYNVRDQPGYDCHGLPIELSVEKSFGVEQKKDIESLGLEKFISACKQFAENNARSMSRIFADLGVWMDWPSPYMTNDPYYVESGWWMIKKLHQDGMLQHGRRVVHWCQRCETVLSDYEVALEYTVLRDPSIYVKFPVAGKSNEYLLTWTTTPWTLPSNVAVMVHPEFEYVRAKSVDEVYILAKERLDYVAKESGKSLTVLESFAGKKLAGVQYLSPLEKLVSAQAKLSGGHVVVLSAEYVNLKEGTGCVHSAPGHGEADYEVGTEYGLPVLMLVDGQGNFHPDAGKYAGKSARGANKEIIEDLRRSGFLLSAGELEHRSPVCWRCRTPLLLRATEQWFVPVKQLKERMLRDVDSTTWVPEWAGANQFKNWLAGLRDWVVSRQRFWGTPLPVWSCKDCGKHEVVGSVKELEEKATEGNGVVDLHIPWVDQVTLPCECGSEMRRVPDVLDVWFDSGRASFSSLRYPDNQEESKLWWPADLIIEGRDQISGWFFKLLKAGLLALGEKPFRNVLMHGFLLDASGREMHKSLGNYVTPQEAVDKSGRDALRYYVLQTTVWEDLKFSWKVLEQFSRELVTVWNVFLFASTYMNLDAFQPELWTLDKLRRRLRKEDRWLLSRCAEVIETVTRALDEYRVHDALRAIRKFIVEHVSHGYVRFVRRRTWVERDDPGKLAAYTTLYVALKNALVLFAPFTPFISEQIYRGMFLTAEESNPESVHLLPWPEEMTEWRDRRLEREMDVARGVISAAAEARMKAKLKLRQPVKRVTIVTTSEDVKRAVASLRQLVIDQINAKSLTVASAAPERGRLVVHPNLGAIGQAFREKSTGVIRALAKAKPTVLQRQIKKNGYVTVRVSGKPVRIQGSHLEFEERYPAGTAVGAFQSGQVYVNTRLSRREIEEGFSRDLVRRMQQMRKELDLKVEAYIDAAIVAPDTEALKMIQRSKSYLQREVRIRRFSVSTSTKEGLAFTYSREWEIQGVKYRVFVSPSS